MAQNAMKILASMGISRDHYNLNKFKEVNMPIYSSKEVRERFNITQQQLEKLIETGLMKPVMLKSGKSIFSEYDVERVATALEAKTTKSK